MAELGQNNVTVVDQGPIPKTGGSTVYAPTGLTQTSGDRTMSLIAQETKEVYDRAGGASDRTPPAENAMGAPHPHDVGDETDADHEVTTQELSELTVERVGVDDLTIESLALGAVGTGQGPANAPGSAADDEKGSTDRDKADGEGTAAVEHESETLSLVAASSVTVETAASDSIAVRDVRGSAGDGSHGR